VALPRRRDDARAQPLLVRDAPPDRVGGAASPGVWLYAALFSFFLCEYLFFERVHLYTYDFFAERVGFKLGWGCLLFYPYFYAVGLWSVADLPDPGSRRRRCSSRGAVLRSAGRSRAARTCRSTRSSATRAPFLGHRARGRDRRQRKLLVSGFWGVSRHVNYLGEILMAVGLTLALGHPGDPSTWLYPVYYVALLVPRQRRRPALRREVRTAVGRYTKRVRYRIVPGLY
jgi:hypothetical protein